jgi:alkylhydroperoxidase family enzyme
VRRLGLDDEAIVELMAVVDLFIGLNHFNTGMQVEPDEKPWHG